MLMERKKHKVLIVEDTRSISQVIQHSITTQLHIDVDSAQTMAEAKEILDAESEKYFAAILDLNLPDAPDGEIVDYVLSKDVPPIILTGSLCDDLHDEMMEKSIIDYVVKRNLNEIEYVLDTIKRIWDNINRKVLIVDDSKSSRMLMRSLLERHYYNVLEASEGTEALEILDNHDDIILVITDYNMPKMDGMELCARIREKYSRNKLAVIALSTTGSGKVSVKLLKSGANDFMTRPYLHEEFYCRVNQNIDSVVSYRKIFDAANEDFLTGLFNRKYFFEIGEKLFQNAKREHISLTVAVVDIDHFKNINDTYGHHVGDLALIHFASIFSDMFREADVIARTGGEEFCLIGVNLSKDDAKQMFERFRVAIEQKPLLTEDLTIPMTVSVGFTMELSDSLDHMINVADSALYLAKKGGRNRIIDASNKSN